MVIATPSTAPAPGALARGRSWWDDRGVRTKVLTAVGTASVVAATIGIVGTVSLNSASTTAKSLYTDNITGVATIAAMVEDVQTMRVESRNALLSQSPADTDKAAQNISAMLDKYAADQKIYVDSGTTPDTQAKIEQAQAIVDKWKADFTGTLLPLARNHDVAGWVTANAAAQQLTPATDALHDARDVENKRAETAANAAVSAASQARTTMLLTLAIGILAALAVGFLVASALAKGVGRVKAVATALAAGNLTVTSDLRSHDELGQMGTALDSAVDSLRSVMSTVVGSADAVAASSEELSASAAQISASAEETSAQSGVVTAAAEEVSQNVQTVAAGAEEMSASIREIANNATEASQVAAKAVSAAAATNATIAKLGESSVEIGNVVKVITSIAEQTNLLALNATIEAARAGEAGKGFAVVANEVKELAQETAKATEDIARRVEAIQADTGSAVNAIEEITEIVAQISDRQTTIASAVEEQTATTNEMSRNVAEAAGGAGEIAANITGVSTAADATNQALSQTTLAVSELSRMAADLRTTVSRFTY